MPKFFTVLFFAIIVQVSAQTSAPKLINYQGIARDASGVPITSQFDIQFTIKNPTATVHNEFQNGIQPNSLGLFSTVIGKAPNTLTLAAWDNGPFTLDVSINTGSSFTLVGSQQLVSVPFSLFAGNVPSSYTNNILTIGANSYSIGAGSSITPTIIGTGLASVTPTTGPLYSVNVPTASLSYVNASNILSLTQGSTVSTVTLTGSGSNTVTMIGQGNAVVTPTFGSAFTVNVPPQVLTNVSNTVSLSNGGGSIVVPSLTLSNGPGITINGSWPTQTISASGTTNTPWVKSANTITLSAINDIVGIGMVLPTAKLDVAGNATTTSSILKVTNTNTNNSSPAIIVSSNGGAAINATDNSAAGANAGEFNSTNGNAIHALTNSNARSAIIGENASITSNALAFGIHGKTSNPDGNAAGIFGENLGGGHGVKGITNGTVAAVRAINQHTATMAPFADGVYGSTSNNSSASAGVYGVNLGGGPGVFGSNSNGTFAGILGSASGAAPAIQGNNSGNGHAIHGVKTGTTLSGNAGRFEINNSSNTADAVFAASLGSGAAVHAVTNTLTTTALGLWVENGHIKVTGSPTFSTSPGTHSVQGGFSTPLVSVNGNDVKGVISFTTGVTGFATLNFCDVKINFGKSYSANPIVVASPRTDLQGLSYMITNVQPSGFVLRLYRSANTPVPANAPSVNFVFNYFVIE
jgi:hypothetical protein